MPQRFAQRPAVVSIPEPRGASTRRAMNPGSRNEPRAVRTESRERDVTPPIPHLHGKRWSQRLSRLGVTQDGSAIEFLDNPAFIGTYRKDWLFGPGTRRPVGADGVPRGRS